MKGCSQNDHHHLNVWDHSLEAAERLEDLLGSLTDQFESAAGRLCRKPGAGKPIARFEAGHAVARCGQTGVPLRGPRDRAGHLLWA